MSKRMTHVDTTSYRTNVLCANAECIQLCSARFSALSSDAATSLTVLRVLCAMRGQRMQTKYGWEGVSAACEGRVLTTVTYADLHVAR
ncbi:hypothetical protein [Acinetobacter baumannii]|uniref:hypothetical protein n=1 Tax=Acinetobacter baumannii TaxID=470 RepID=UPI00339348A5